MYLRFVSPRGASLDAGMDVIFLFFVTLEHKPR